MDRRFEGPNPDASGVVADSSAHEEQEPLKSGLFAVVGSFENVSLFAV